MAAGGKGVQCRDSDFIPPGERKSLWRAGFSHTRYQILEQDLTYFRIDRVDLAGLVSNRDLTEFGS